MTDATTQLKIGASLDGSFETTTNTAKRKIDGIGTAAGEAGKKTGAIGDGIDSSAKKVESATNNMIRSIQRQTAALEAGDKSSRQYQESLARMRGVDVAALKPYLDQLEAMKTKQAEAADTAESLAIGMSKVEALAAFAAVAAGSFVVLSKSIIDMADGLNDIAQSVGISVKELGKFQLAAEQSGTSLDAIARGVKGLAKNMIENGDALRKAGIDATNADGALQQLADVFKDMPDGVEKTTLAVELFGKAGMDLIPMLNLGSEGLRDAAMASAEYAQQMSIMAPLADQLNDQMAEIALASKTAGAVMVNEFLPSLNQIAAALLGAETGANSFAQAFGATVNTVLQTTAVLISDVSFVLKGMGREIGGIIAQFSALGEGGGIFSAEGRRAWTAVGDAMKEDADRARKELDKWQSDLLNGVRKSNAAVQSEYNKRQGFGEKGSVGSALLAGLGGGDSAAKKAASDANKELEKRASILAELSGYTKDYEETQQRYAAMLKSGALTQEAYNRATQELVAKQPGMVALTKEQADAQKLLDKSYAETIKQVDDYEKQQQKSMAAAADEVTKAKEAYDSHGKLASIIQEETLARMQNNREIMAGANEDLTLIDAQISAKKELIQILRNGEARDAVEDLAKANKKAAEESSKYWEDALMRAFESGKGFFESLWSTIKNTLKTQVLKVLVTGSMTGVSALASAATGGATSAGGSLLGNALTSIFPGVSATVSTFGNAAIAGIQSMVGMTGTVAQASTAVANGLAYAVNGVGSTAASAGSMFAAAAPWLAGAAALYAIAQATKGETRAGGQYGYSIDGTTAFNARRGTSVAANGVGATYLEGPSGGDPYANVASTVINATVDHINDLFAAIGSTSAITAFQAGYETSDKNRGGVFAGGTLTGGVTFGDSGTGDNYAGTLYDSSKGFNLDAKGAIEAFSLDLKQSTIEALQAAQDIPQAIADMIKVDAKALTDEAATALLTSIDALVGDVTLLGTAFEQLPFAELRDLSFDASAGLIKAAGSLQALTDSLAGYYQNFYSDAEQTANLTRVLGGTFESLGLSMPVEQLREWYRGQVEAAMALDQSVPANQAYLAGLLSIQSGVNNLATSAESAAQRIIDAAAKLEAEIVSAQESAMQEYMSAQLEYNSLIAAEQESAAQAMQAAAEAIESAMASAGQGIVAFIQSLLNTPVNAAANYRTDLALAQQGDVEASKRLPTSGRAYLDTQINSSATAYEAARATAKMVQELNALPAVKSYEQQLLEAVGGTTKAVQDLNGKLITELTVTARSEITKLINFVANTDDLPDDLKQLALGATSTFTKTVEYVLGSVLSPDMQALALEQNSTLTKTVRLALGDDLPDETKRIVLMASESVSKTIGLVAFSTMSADQQAMVLQTTGSITKTISLAAGELDQVALGVAFAQSGTIERIVKASGGVLTPEQQQLLSAVDVYNKTVNIDVKLDATELTAFQTMLKEIFGTISIPGISGDGLGGVDLTDIVGQAYLDRLESINTYINSLDWSLENSKASAWATYYAAQQYGVSQADIANATGLNYSDIQALFDSANVPRFAMGTNYLPSDMLAQVHQGERIIPAADNRELMSRLQDPQQNSVALVAEIKALRDDNAAQARAMVQLQQRLTKLMERWDSNGLPTERLET